MSRKKLEIGTLGENMAVDYIEKQGYKIIDRNFRAKNWGEIDIVAVKDNTTVFVEVKTRLSNEYGEPQEAVTHHKIQSLMRTGLYYKETHLETPNSLRIDVVAITLDKVSKRPLAIELFVDAQ